MPKKLEGYYWFGWKDDEPYERIIGRIYVYNGIKYVTMGEYDDKTLKETLKEFDLLEKVVPCSI